MKEKVAVVLMNLGGPSELKDIRPFLFNLFIDKNIIALPFPLRFVIAWLIAKFRAPKAMEEYEKIVYERPWGKIHGISPLILETNEQARLLEQELNISQEKEYKTFICMRYWHPMSKEVAQAIDDWNPNRIVLLPLYPQYSKTTSYSSIQDFKRYYKNKNVKIDSILHHYDNVHFIESHVKLLVDTINNQYGNDNLSNIMLLFSAHGLPCKIIEEGDTYQFHIERSVHNIMHHANMIPMITRGLQHKICYQSKVGPLPWLEPNTEAVITSTAAENKDIIVVPIAFVSEHIETLVELDITYAEIAHNKGVRYIRIPTLSTNPAYISCLVDVITTI